jgi:hypothetical protein
MRPGASVHDTSSRKYFCRLPPKRLRLLCAAFAIRVTIPSVRVKKEILLSVSPASAERTIKARADRKDLGPADGMRTDFRMIFIPRAGFP